jgi:tetratricopeptide (TPR) repeat protein
MFPPAPNWPRDETALLAETEAPLSLLLWQRARDVRLWALAGEGSRTGLFTELEGVEGTMEAAEGAAEALAVPLRTLRALVRFPELVTAADVCAACLAISEWADGEHMSETALHYAEAAALADPTSARAAAVAGAACARVASDQRAEVWLTRAIRTAWRSKDWEWHARAYIRMGQLMYELGHLAKARRAYYRARSSAKWSGHYAYAGKAHHDLLLVECAVGTYSAGETHARKALELYPGQFPRIPHLAHDFAFLLTCHGAYADALVLLDAALPFFVRSWEKVAILGTIAKAAAATGQRERYAEAVADLLLLGSAAETHSAAALVLAAEGATMLGDNERARRLAARALELAERRHEREPLRRARQVLEGGDEQRAAPPPSEYVAPLRDQFIDRLRELRASVAGAVTGEELARFTMSGRT